MGVIPHGGRSWPPVGGPTHLTRRGSLHRSAFSYFAPYSAANCASLRSVQRLDRLQTLAATRRQRTLLRRRRITESHLYGRPHCYQPAAHALPSHRLLAATTRQLTLCDSTRSPLVLALLALAA